MRGLGDIEVADLNGRVARLDLSAVDWPAYIAKAVEYLRWQWPLPEPRERKAP